MNHNLHNAQGMRVASWLNKNGYSTIDEWGLDSDLTCTDGVWYNEDGDEVDLFSVAWYAMEAANESDRESF